MKRRSKHQGPRLLSETLEAGDAFTAPPPSQGHGSNSDGGPAGNTDHGPPTIPPFNLARLQPEQPPPLRPRPLHARGGGATPVERGSQQENLFGVQSRNKKRGLKIVNPSLDIHPTFDHRRDECKPARFAPLTKRSSTGKKDDDECCICVGDVVGCAFCGLPVGSMFKGNTGKASGQSRCPHQAYCIRPDRVVTPIKDRGSMPQRSTVQRPDKGSASKS